MPLNHLRTREERIEIYIINPALSVNTYFIWGVLQFGLSQSTPFEVSKLSCDRVIQSKRVNRLPVWSIVNLQPLPLSIGK